MKSEEIKAFAYWNRVALWRIADKLNVCENTIVRWLREDLPEEKQRIILDAITEIIAERTKI